ncbi:MAG TPA: di-heme oxidoredictase family protein [Oscillatoriaceae cyanobacterium]
MKLTLRRLFVMLAPVGLIGCSAMSVPVGTSAVATANASFVQPIPGLTAEQVAQFNRGRQLFEHRFAPSEGLGPLYNQVSCATCHGSFPDTGSGSIDTNMLVGGFSKGEVTSLVEAGGPAVRLHAIDGVPLEGIPMDAKFISQRISPPTFGLGLIEAIPSDDIAARLADDATRDALGIHGQANWEFGEVGRFGWKANKGDLTEMVQNACEFEMGLSSPARPREDFPDVPPQVLASPANLNDAAHPFVKAFFDAKASLGIPQAQTDLSQQQVDDLVSFPRFQAPPSPLPLTNQAQLGQHLFTSVHCAACHVPSMKTGPNNLGVPSGLDVPAYSDLLIHDMGPGDSDGLIMNVATGQQWRTAPLWGLRYRTEYMHDGRAGTLDQAIQDHGGEAAKVVDAYNALSPDQRAAIIAFLKSL